METLFSLLIDTEQRNFGSALRYNLKLGDHDILAGINHGKTNVVGGNYRNDGGQRNGITTEVDNDAQSTEVFLVVRWQFSPQWTLMYGAQGVLADREVRGNPMRRPRG